MGKEGEDYQVRSAQVTGVWPLANLDTMISVGNMLGIKVEVKAKEGEFYPLKSRSTFATVGPGDVYLEINWEVFGVLNEFWQKVNAAKTKPVAS